MKHKPSVPVPSPEKKPAQRQDSPTSMVSSSAGQAPTLHTPEQPPIENYGPVEWRNQRDGYLYAHCVYPHVFGKTHKAIVHRVPNPEDPDGPPLHTGLFWEGTEAEFFATFRKE